MRLVYLNASTLLYYTQPSYIYVAYSGHLKFNYSNLMEYYVFYGKREALFIYEKRIYINYPYSNSLPILGN